MAALAESSVSAGTPVAVTLAVLLIVGQSAGTVVFCTVTVIVPPAARLATLHVNTCGGPAASEQPVTAGLIVQPVPWSVSLTMAFVAAPLPVFVAVIV